MHCGVLWVVICCKVCNMVCGMLIGVMLVIKIVHRGVCVIVFVFLTTFSTTQRKGQSYTTTSRFSGRIFDTPSPTKAGPPFLGTANFSSHGFMLGRKFEESTIKTELTVQYVIHYTPYTIHHARVTLLHLLFNLCVKSTHTHHHTPHTHAHTHHTIT